MTDHKSPIDQALDLVVYAPIGFALEARRLLPTFVDRGRAQVQMTRMIGQFAVKQGQQVAEKRLARAQAHADGVLGDLGLASDDSGEEGAGADTSANGTTAPRAAATQPAPTQSGEGASSLAIPDYDSLAASQVIPRLGGLTDGELADVARYEQAHRSRKTILGKISQLQDR